MARGALPVSARKRVYSFIAAAMTLLFVVVTFQHADLSDDSFLTSLEHRWIDAKFKIRGEQVPGGDIVIVGIDQRTLDGMGSFRTMRHGNYAKLVDKLAEAKPSVIGFDMMFPDPDLSNPGDDKQFGD